MTVILIVDFLSRLMVDWKNEMMRKNMTENVDIIGLVSSILISIVILLLLYLYCSIESKRSYDYHLSEVKKLGRVVGFDEKTMDFYIEIHGENITSMYSYLSLVPYDIAKSNMEEWIISEHDTR